MVAIMITTVTYLLTCFVYVTYYLRFCQHIGSRLGLLSRPTKLRRVDFIIIAIQFAQWAPSVGTINPRGETGGAVGGLGTFGDFILACANALCEFHTTVLNSTAITGTTSIAFNVFVITTIYN